MKFLIVIGIVLFSTLNFASTKLVNNNVSPKPLDQICPTIIDEALKSEASILSLSEKLMSKNVSELIAKSITDSFTISLPNNDQKKHCSRIKYATVKANSAVKSIADRHSSLDDIEYAVKSYRIN